ncbi:hypothetical protein TRSC58_04911 [Trypanosoma rangeli SC58]|uniref:Uncharacterized protein n=1 Tax=Trypanosoma rangeli SC58 TaxID=429131 RepID=A0A061IXI7_TRYRA|nr:hypothetical protein TRSC58_04911 [Trypanosoma rangeli SC58]
MLSRCRPNFVRPLTLLSFTINECIGDNKVGLWATLSMSRRSSRDLWELGVYQRKNSIYLNPLPDKVVADSVVAKQFLSRASLPYMNAIRIVSVNGVPAVSASKVRHELSRCSTAVLHLVLHSTRYRLPEKRQEEELNADGVTEPLVFTEMETPEQGLNLQKEVDAAVVTDAHREKAVSAEANSVMAGDTSHAQHMSRAPTPKRSPKQTKSASLRRSKKKAPNKLHETPTNTRANTTSDEVHAGKTSKRVTPKATGPAKDATVSI